MSAALPHEKKARTQIVEFAKMFPLDVQIGAVEIKDHDSSARANVGESAKANALAVTVATDDSLHSKIGEVSATPTANTLLDRLKGLNDWDESDRAKVNLIAGQVGISAGAGTVGANTPRVTHASDDPVTVSLAALDNIVESNRAAVNPISGQTGVAAGAGTVGTTTQRVTLASDDPAVTSLAALDNVVETNRAAVNPISGQVGVAAGAGAVGATVQRMTLASDDPAVTSLAALDNIVESNRAAVNPISGQTGVAAGAGAVGATTQRVTLASDDPGVAKLEEIRVGIVTTLGGYVDGLEALITTTNSQTDAVEAPLATLAGAVSGTEMQVDVVAALPAGTNTIGAVNHATTGIGHGVTTVTTAGTDVVLASSTSAKWVTIQAQTDNTGYIAVGATGVDATVATGTGILLVAGESITIPCDNLNDIYIDSTVNGDGVRYTYGT